MEHHDIYSSRYGVLLLLLAILRTSRVGVSDHVRLSSADLAQIGEQCGYEALD